jgi:transposase-like protein
LFLGVWLFGGICRNTKECFVIEVPDRKKNTLIPLIKQNIQKGSIIVSDEWKAYASLKDDPDYAAYETVCHKYEFVNSDFPEVHTNSIENLWRWIKDKVPNNLPPKKRHLFLTQAMYIRKYKWNKLSHYQRFRLLCEHISQLIY